MKSILSRFFKDIEAQNIRYCHWKSIDRMDEVMEGRTDIDLLIDDKQTALFRSLLAEYKAIPVRPRLWMTYPSMEDFLIYDSHIGKFYHLHLHYRLIMGKKNAKEYILPLEELYLKTRVKHSKYDTYIVNPELDLIMLLLRYSVKYSSFQKNYQKIRGHKVSEIREMQYLIPLCDENILKTTAKKVDAKLDADGQIATFFENEYYKNPKQHIRKLKQLKKSITLYRRAGYLEVFFVRKLRKYLNLFAAFGRNNAKHTVQGGLTVALVGADGSGKTTITDRVIKELRTKLSARKYYMGFNARSFSYKTKLLALLSYIPRGAKFIFKNDFGKKINIFGQLIIEYGGYLDRKKLYDKSLRDKANGMIGFYERFPLKNTIDYPQSFFNKEDLKVIEKSKYLTKLRLQLEKKYDKLKPADINFFIKTPPDVIRSRREMSDKTFEKVKRKFKRVDDFVTSKDYFITIDASRPLDDVVLEVKNYIFKNLC